MTMPDTHTVSAPACGLRIGKTTHQVYSLLQKGELSGICQDGRWLVSESSIAAYLERREPAIAATSAA
jgi:hypothetical protein